MKFGEFIKEKRGTTSQRKFADLCELPNSEISRIESGERKHPSIEALIKLSKGIGIPLMELIEEYTKERV